ncbi:MAG: spoII [Candidatus Berkelbacteria bacterium]|nr:spoII [Candidatus Berkelbacteria bacterium]
MSLDKFSTKGGSPLGRKIEETAGNLMKHFDSAAKIKVDIDDTSCNVEIETEISGLLIGRHGETLEALQHLLRLLVWQEQAEFIPLVVDISGYRAARQGELEELAKNSASKVKEFGGSESLPSMSAYERRLIHMILQDIEGIESESEGEEPYRRIVIRPKIK